MEWYFKSAFEYQIRLFTTAHFASLDNKEGALTFMQLTLGRLVMLCYNAAAVMYLPWEKCWNHVQAANMKKIRAQSDGSDSKRSSSFDVVKPEGWVAPDAAIVRELMDAGWCTPDDIDMSYNINTGKVTFTKFTEGE
jgi:hypothetical protein